MRVTQTVKKILDWYEGDNPGVKANLALILSTGKLGRHRQGAHSPVDQGFEHGPARSFAPNPPAYDPHYRYQLAIEAGLNAYAEPLRMIAQGADTFAGQIPTILKCNSSNSLATNKDQAVNAGVKDALKAGLRGDWLYHLSGQRVRVRPNGRAAGVDRRGKRRRARRGRMELSAWPESRQDWGDRPRYLRLRRTDGSVLGAIIIKVKPPTAVIGLEAAKKSYEKVDGSTLAKRVEQIMHASFAGKRVVVFSGGEAMDLDGVYEEVRGIRDGGGNGSIIGRNTFQRPKETALEMLGKIIDIYLGKA